MILKTLDDFKNVVPTAVGTEHFSDFEPYVQSAELWLKTNVLGKTLYDLINTYAESSSIDSTSGSTPVVVPNEDLVRLCQSVVGNHAYWDAIPFLDVIQTESGFAVISASGKVPASKERVERLREQCLIRRDNEVESLIAYLEENEAYHDAWKVSPAYSVLTDCLISTAAELKLYSQWEGTRKDFMQLRAKLIWETMAQLEPMFSKDYIEELIQKQRDENLTGDDTKVLHLIKYALGSLVAGNNEAAGKIMNDALFYIDKSIESFDTYVDSIEYKARITEGYTNTTDSPIFSSIH